MNITSIISEYNPFHEGHKFHMEATQKLTNADYTIVIMSGNFTQRGTPAIINKYARTRQALLEGADLVLELPVCFASASAEVFAFGAISILNKLGVINSLVFGSECGDIHSLKKIADFPSSNEAYRVQTTFSDCDINGHVNNIRYACYVMDALELSKDKHIKTFQIDYTQEVASGTVLHIHSDIKDNEIFAKGVGDDDKKKFSCHITF